MARYQHEPDSSERPTYTIIDTQPDHPRLRVVAERVSLPYAVVICKLLNKALMEHDIKVAGAAHARN